MIKRIINLRSKTITFSAGLIAFSVGVSALLGLLRDRILIQQAELHLAGISSVDIYFAAFRIPDFVYGILITGGIVAAFLPVFSNTVEKDREKGWELASNTLNALSVTLIFLCGFLFLIAPFLVELITPGFSAEDIEKTVFLTRIMLVSPVLLGIAGLFSGILQYYDRFLAYSLAPIFYNVGIIFGIIFFTPVFGLPGLAYGVILGAVLHLLIKIVPTYFTGFSYRPVLDINQKELRRIFYLMVPRIIGQASVKVNIIIITALASMLAAGSISVFNLANHLQAFPVRAIGVAFAVAAFPALSKSIALKEKDMFFKKLSLVMRQVLFLIIPVSIIVFLLRAQIVRVVLGVEGFGWSETQLTAASLGIFAFSFFAATLVHVLVRVFFSFQDTRTPVIASVLSMGVNIGLAFFFVWALGFENFFRSFLVSVLRLEGVGNVEVIAFPLAIFFSSLLHLILLFLFLQEKLEGFKGFGIKECLQKTLFASFFMGGVVYLTRNIAGNMLNLDTFFKVLTQGLVAFLAGFLVYILTAKILESRELLEIKESFFKNKES